MLRGRDVVEMMHIGANGRLKVAICAAGIALSLSAAPAIGLEFGYKGRVENKTVAELDLMTPVELNKEASRVCWEVTTFHQRELYSEAKSYIETIGRVARRKKGGTEPAWVSKVAEALYGGDSGPCFWQDEPDRKATTQLESMNPCDLYSEALGVCQTVYTYKRTSQPRAFLDYLHTILRVASKRLGGQPDWITRMRAGDCPPAQEKCPVPSR